jgi:hypothetical protein
MHVHVSKRMAMAAWINAPAHLFFSGIFRGKSLLLPRFGEIFR